uniref:Mitochondrial import inner membrane translocase subunit TIM50 n=1 Tax=Ixodes ricinus TaxID=34613 RepID=V5HJF7_IXORI
MAAVGRAGMCVWHGLRPKICSAGLHRSTSGLPLFRDRSSPRVLRTWLPSVPLGVPRLGPVRFTSTSGGGGAATPTGTSGSTSGGSSGRPADDFSQRAMKYTFVAFGAIFTGVAGYLVVSWGAPSVDETGKEVEDEYSSLPSWKAHLYRTYKELLLYNKMIQEPSRDKLLPDPLTEPYFQPPYTLVLEMTGVLVHPDWTYQTGWRFKKRPGVNLFLQQVGPPLFEVVVYTSEQGFTAYPILDSLDPQGFIMYRLFRDATRYTKGHHVKDLSCLNRDLSKVILVDWSEEACSLQPRNALRLRKWDGGDEDRTLLDLAQFLRTIGTSEVEDVRTVLDYYRQFEDPLMAFKENQKRLQEEKQLASIEALPSQRSWTKGLWKRN